MACRRLEFDSPRFHQNIIDLTVPLCINRCVIGETKMNLEGWHIKGDGGTGCIEGHGGMVGGGGKDW